MPLESLQPNARTDVRRTAVESPRKTESLDFGLESGDFELMKKTLDNYKKQDRINLVRSNAEKMNVLYPNKQNELGIDEIHLQITLNDIENTTVLFNKVGYISFIRKFWPKKLTEVKSYNEIRETTINAMYKLKERDLSVYGQQLPEVWLAFPELKNEFQIDEDLFLALAKAKDVSYLTWKQKLGFVALLKKLFPKNNKIPKLFEKVLIIAPNMVESERKMVKKNLTPADSLIDILSNLKILAAKDVIFEDGKMELIMEENEGENVQEVPLKKQF